MTVYYLFMLGSVFIAAAAVGGRLKAGGVQIPIIATKFARIGLALTGMLAIGLGVQEHYWNKSAPPPSPSASTVLPGGPSTTMLQKADPPDSPVGYQGAVAFSHDEVDGELDLDFNPPRRVNNHNIKQLSGKPNLSGDKDVLLAEWDHQANPAKQQCADQLAHHGVAQTGPLVAGNVVCVRTTQGRIARLIITSADNDQIRADATIWNT
ncbi:MAG: hypothetical protein ACRDTX_11570 [Pseudonocardiaceae bacterium]